MMRNCWIVTYKDHSGDDSSYAFYKKEDAIKSVSEDVITEMKSLEKEGYRPVYACNDEDHKEIFVPNTGISVSGLLNFLRLNEVRI